MQVWYAIKRLSLGLTLIVVASAVLLISDKSRRPAEAGSGRVPRIAILQHASSELLDAGVRGMLVGLAEAGYRDGETINISKYNAQGDLAAGNAIARQVTNGEFDLVLTSSTPSMQAVAHVNREGKTRHVFGLVADPFSAGVGLDRDDPMQHPAHMVGQGTFMPVAESFAMARQMLPSLRAVGVVWNPAETNSVAFTTKAREACRTLGLTLLEANADNSAAVIEGIGSLVSRGAQALWVGGDNTVMTALNAVIAAGRSARIPVFSITPGTPDRGTLFDVGLDFQEVGRLSGLLAGQVLSGRDPSTIPIRDVQDEVPRRVVVNVLALEGLRERWRIPADVLDKATVVVDRTGVHEKTRGAERAVPLGRKWRVDLVQFNRVLDVEEAEEGVLAGLREAGLVEGRDYETTIRNAHGDMATINSLIDTVLAERTDLIITFSTPTLQAALQRARHVPIVFNYVASPFAAGAGRTDTDHLPNVTGVYMFGAFDEMLVILRTTMPSAKVIGTLYVPAEVNSVFQRDRLIDATTRAGVRLVSVAANTSAEVADAALALVSQPIDAIVQVPGNLTAAAFPSIGQAARQARLPVFAFQTSQARAGAAVVLARDYADGGRQAAALAARVMRGERPAAIPFQPVGDTRLVVNPEAARHANLTLPASVLAQAHEVIGR